MRLICENSILERTFQISYKCTRRGQAYNIMKGREKAHPLPVARCKPIKIGRSRRRDCYRLQRKEELVEGESGEWILILVIGLLDLQWSIDRLILSDSRSIDEFRDIVFSGISFGFLDFEILTIRSFIGRYLDLYGSCLFVCFRFSLCKERLAYRFCSDKTISKIKNSVISYQRT